MDLIDKMQQYADDVIGQCTIPLIGAWYCYYEVPWDHSYYVKFPVESLVRSISEPDRIEFVCPIETEHTDSFLTDCYLGGARDSDTHILKKIIGDRTEMAVDYL